MGFEQCIPHGSQLRFWAHQTSRTSFKKNRCGTGHPSRCGPGNSIQQATAATRPSAWPCSPAFSDFLRPSSRSSIRGGMESPRPMKYRVFHILDRRSIRRKGNEYSCSNSYSTCWRILTRQSSIISVLPTNYPIGSKTSVTFGETRRIRAGFLLSPSWMTFISSETATLGERSKSCHRLDPPANRCARLWSNGAEREKFQSDFDTYFDVCNFLIPNLSNLRNEGFR